MPTAAKNSSVGRAGWPPRTAGLPSSIQTGTPISAPAVRAPLHFRTARPEARRSETLGLEAFGPDVSGHEVCGLQVRGMRRRVGRLQIRALPLLGIRPSEQQQGRRDPPASNPSQFDNISIIEITGSRGVPECPGTMRLYLKFPERPSKRSKPSQSGRMFRRTRLVPAAVATPKSESGCCNNRRNRTTWAAITWLARGPGSLRHLSRRRGYAAVVRSDGLEVVVAAGALVRVEVGWRDEPGNPGPEPDGPRLFVDQVVVMGAQQGPVLRARGSAAGPVVMWWASHQGAGMVQPGKAQPRSRAMRALRRWGGKSRVARPMSRIRPWLPSRTGMMSASQAIFRMVEAVTGPVNSSEPVSRTAPAGRNAPPAAPVGPAVSPAVPGPPA